VRIQRLLVISATTSSATWRCSGVSQAFITVTARVQPANDGSGLPMLPGDLAGYEFELNGECHS
jgi:hypothetical protein